MTRFSNPATTMSIDNNLRFANHPDSDVRYAAVLALTGHEE